MWHCFIQKWFCSPALSNQYTYNFRKIEWRITTLFAIIVSDISCSFHILSYFTFLFEKYYLLLLGKRNDTYVTRISNVFLYRFPLTFDLTCEEILLRSNTLSGSTLSHDWLSNLAWTRKWMILLPGNLTHEATPPRRHHGRKWAEQICDWHLQSQILDG